MREIHKPNASEPQYASRATTTIYRRARVREANLNPKGGELCYASENSAETLQICDKAPISCQIERDNPQSPT
jgi:hypothetical protein